MSDGQNTAAPLDGRGGYVVKDSGVREEFATGSRRDTRSGKGRFDLLPWGVIQRDADLLERGAVKYGERNWEKGQPVSRFLDSAIRHISCFMQGQTEEDHLASARWNLAGVMFVLDEVAAGRLPKELADLPWMGGK